MDFGIPTKNLPRAQFFSVPSRSLVLNGIPYGVGVQQIFSELLQVVVPVGTIENLHIKGNKCIVRYELPTQARRAVAQIRARVTDDFYLKQIYACLQSDASILLPRVHLRNFLKIAADASRTLYVRNFGRDTTRAMLANIFQGYGELKQCPDIYEHQGDLAGFVTFSHREDYQIALQEAQGLQLPDGTHLWVAPRHIHVYHAGMNSLGPV